MGFGPAGDTNGRPRDATGGVDEMVFEEVGGKGHELVLRAAVAGYGGLVALLEGGKEGDGRRGFGAVGR